MKGFLTFLKWLLIIVILAVAAIYITGNQHLFKGVKLTYLKGLSGPTIDDYKHFKSNQVKRGKPQPWRKHPNFNKTSLSKDDIEYHKKFKSVAYLVIKDDKLLHESYWNGYSQKSLTNSFSMAKSIVGVLVGCAIQDGLIKSVNDPAVNYIPEYKEVIGDKVTIKHLLTMSSGIDFDESYGNPFGMMAKAYYGRNIPELVKEYRPTGEPGEEFDYLGGNTLLLGFIVENVTGEKLATYATEKLWRPIGSMYTALWSTDDETRSERSYCCFYSNARDFARIGKLYLDSGRWNGKQIVPVDYVLNATSPTLNMEGGHQYGYHWWYLEYNKEPVFYARGIQGQYIFVRPQKNMIVVRLGHIRDKERKSGVPKDVFRWLEMSDNL